MSLRWYAFLCGFGSDVLFTIDHLRSISFFCQNAHHDWLTKEYISNWFLVSFHFNVLTIENITSNKIKQENRMEVKTGKPIRPVSSLPLDKTTLQKENNRLHKIFCYQLKPDKQEQAQKLKLIKILSTLLLNWFWKCLMLMIFFLNHPLRAT